VTHNSCMSHDVYWVLVHHRRAKNTESMWALLSRFWLPWATHGTLPLCRMSLHGSTTIMRPSVWRLLMHCIALAGNAPQPFIPHGSTTHATNVMPLTSSRQPLHVTQSRLMHTGSIKKLLRKRCWMLLKRGLGKKLGQQGPESLLVSSTGTAQTCTCLRDLGCEGN